MDITFPTQAELDAINKTMSDAQKRYSDAKNTFEADYKRRKDEVARKRAALDSSLDELRKKHAEAMQSVGVAIADGLDGDLETERADNIAAEIFKLEQRAKALATLTVKADDALFDSVLKTYKEMRAVKDATWSALIAYEKRAEETAAHFTTLHDNASKESFWLGQVFLNEDEIVNLYERVRGPLDGPNYLKARTIANM